VLRWERALEIDAEDARQACRKILASTGAMTDPSAFDPGFDIADLRANEDDPSSLDEATARSIETFNPLSTKQLADVLFNKWKIAPVGYTETGDPTTGDAALRKLMTDETLPQVYRDFVKATRVLRRRIKYLGYVRAVRFAPGEPGCCIMPDGYVRAHWNATGKGSGDEGGTTSGRLTSSPNMQNWPSGLRSMVIPPDGCVFVAADGDQIELRYIAAMTQARLYLDAFDRALQLAPNHPDGDAHRMMMIRLFGAAEVRSYTGQPEIVNGAWTKGSGNYKKSRDLEKRVQYACVAEGMPVAVLSPEGSVPIEAVTPGVSWTWTWSKRRNQYEPALITALQPQGPRPCVRVAFRWRRGRKGWGDAAVEVTPDHVFLLRDGTERAAGQLVPGDRLMPFNRFTDQRGYRWVDARNGDGYAIEHRGVIVPTGTVHHADGNRRNNTPGNLRSMPAAVHSALHMTAARGVQLAHGRRVSPAWRAAVADPATRSAAACKAWAARRQRDPAAGCGPAPSVLDAHSLRVLVGVQLDRVVAREAGITAAAVRHYRKRHGIQPPPPGQRRNHVVVSVAPCGLRETWDLTVAHEDHNFALAAGVFVHNCQYAAEPPTVLRVITSSENKKGELIYAHFTQRYVRKLRNDWLAAVPEIVAYWSEQERLFAAQGYLEERVTGRRRFFLDGGKRQELANFPIQAGCAGLINTAMLRVVAGVPFGAWGPGTGLVGQFHDALMAAVPIGIAPDVRAFFTRAMTAQLPQLPGVVFTAEASSGPRWSAV
jgi:hypothetical protein